VEKRRQDGTGQRNQPYELASIKFEGKKSKREMSRTGKIRSGACHERTPRSHILGKKPGRVAENTVQGGCRPTGRQLNPSRLSRKARMIPESTTGRPKNLRLLRAVKNCEGKREKPCKKMRRRGGQRKDRSTSPTGEKAENKGSQVGARSA